MYAMGKLQRIYLCTHALAWSKHGDGLREMDDIERHEKLDMAEDWPDSTSSMSSSRRRQLRSVTL